jgi:hypothetical protein
VVAQRALAGRLAGMPVVQRKLNFMGTEINPQSEPKDPVPPKLAELRDSPKTYYLPDNWNVSYTDPVSILDGTKKYLLGETHHSGEWEKETQPWSRIAKMAEGGHMMPEDVSTHGAVGGVLPLESVHAFLMGAITMLHNILNGHAQLGEEVPPQGFYESVLFYLREIEKSYPGYDSYVKKQKKPESGDFEGQTKRIVAFHTEFKATYLPAVKRMIVDIKAVIAKKPVEGWKARLNEERKILPIMGRKLGPVTGVDQESETGKGLRDVLRSNEMKGDEASFALREEAMAKNVRAGPAPLLVQIGDLHVVSVAGKVGADSVAVKESVGLAKKTRVKLAK